MDIVSPPHPKSRLFLRRFLMPSFAFVVVCLITEPSIFLQHTAEVFGAGSELPDRSQLPPVANLRAIVTPNNDFSVDEHPKGETVPIPALVGKKIQSIAQASYNKWQHLCRELPDPCPYTEASFSGNVFRITLPRESSYLYVFQCEEPFGAIYYHLIAFDAKHQRITENPPFIYGKWMRGRDPDEELLEPPLVRFNDLDNNGVPELGVKELAHNGTLYNAVVEHYFDIGSDMSLNRRLVLEARLLDLYTEDRNGRIMRRITKLNPDELRIDVSLVLDGNRGPQRKVGEVFLISQNGSYRVTSKRVLDLKYERLLVTGSGVSDDTFLKYGYTFRY